MVENMFKNKKATMILFPTAIFIMVTLIFFYVNYNTKDKFQPVNPGYAQISILETYQQAEKALLYIDLAAKHSADKTIEDLKGEIKQSSTKKDVYDLFSDKFNGYMDEYIEKYTDEELEKQGEIVIPKDNYDLLFKENHLIGIATQNLKINKKNINYSVKPSFKIELDYDIFGEDIKNFEVEEWEGLPDDQIEPKIRAAASQLGLDGDIAVAIARYENRAEYESKGYITHYDKYGNVKISHASCVGVMQVQVGECGMTQEELTDINNNIECGVKVLREKYDMVCYSGVTPITRTGGILAYEEKVLFHCKIEEYVDKYLEYNGNCDKMAIRAYNGLGCDGPGTLVDGKLVNNADEDYVEGVMGYLADLRIEKQAESS